MNLNRHVRHTQAAVRADGTDLVLPLWLADGDSESERRLMLPRCLKRRSYRSSYFQVWDPILMLGWSIVVNDDGSILTFL